MASTSFGPAYGRCIHGEKDGQASFDAPGAETKQLLWIEESNPRFYAYNHFGQHPERLIEWFDTHMSGDTQPQRDKAPVVDLVTRKFECPL